MGLAEEYEKAKFKDKSNERIVKALIELDKIMEKEGRGWLFSPVLQMEGNHNTLCFTKFKNFDEFWATIGMIIIETTKKIPEDYREDFREGFIPCVQMVTELAFPKMKLIPIE